MSTDRLGDCDESSSRNESTARPLDRTRQIFRARRQQYIAPELALLLTTQNESRKRDAIDESLTMTTQQRVD
jgi:hypothetical protein